MALKTVSILGSTGSVGRSTVDLLQHHKDEYRVNVLTAMSNVGLLAEQADALNARKVVIGDVSLFHELSSLLAHTDIKVEAGRAAIIQAAAEPADWIMAAIVGMAGWSRSLLRSGREHAWRLPIRSRWLQRGRW